MARSRLIVGLVLVLAAVVLLVLGERTYSTAGAVALALIGLAAIAASKRR